MPRVLLHAIWLTSFVGMPAREVRVCTGEFGAVRSCAVAKLGAALLGVDAPDETWLAGAFFAAAGGLVLLLVLVLPLRRERKRENLDTDLVLSLLARAPLLLLSVVLLLLPGRSARSALAWPSVADCCFLAAGTAGTGGAASCARAGRTSGDVELRRNAATGAGAERCGAAELPLSEYGLTPRSAEDSTVLRDGVLLSTGGTMSPVGLSVLATIDDFVGPLTVTGLGDGGAALTA